MNLFKAAAALNLFYSFKQNMLLTNIDAAAALACILMLQNLVNLCKAAVVLTIDTMNDMVTIQIIFLEK
jgi:hypothetical protein